MHESPPTALTTSTHRIYVWAVHVVVQLFDAHLGNGTVRRTVTMMAPLILTSGLVRYEAVLHSCGTSPGGERLPTCDSAHSWWLYSATSLEHQATGTIICYPTQSNYPDNEPSSPCHILIILRLTALWACLLTSIQHPLALLAFTDKC